ncbi:uncharacterized protein LOC112539092 [Tetranychus urticae]|uniref:Gustatory receptor n=1 Tax=Tetranychus urticae TaxID=32264 RepID=T1KI55_TETUR|nr:uncharacterized protein LOC112539092 [Tetranychus urticae]
MCSDKKMTTEVDEPIEISSIFTVMVNNKNRKFRYFLLMVILSLTVAIGSYAMYKAYLGFSAFEGLNEKSFFILQLLNGLVIIFSYFILIFVCNWKRFVEFLEVWSQTGLEHDSKTIKYIKYQRKKCRLLILIHVILNVTVSSSTYRTEKQSLEYIFELVPIAFTSFTYAVLLGLITDFSLQILLFICATFLHVNKRLEHLTKFPNSTEDNIGSIRLMHSFGSQMTLKADQFIRHFIACTYSMMITFILIDLYRMIYLSTTPTDYYISIIIQFVVISMTAVFTYYVVKINAWASKGFHHAYQLSFTKNNPSHLAETSLLMYRMGRNDIGLTFANLFTITASFVTSLATLCVTFILAFPTIKSQF